jgi:hypothetical protein
MCRISSYFLSVLRSKKDRMICCKFCIQATSFYFCCRELWLLPCRIHRVILGSPTVLVPEEDKDGREEQDEDNRDRDANS